MALLTRSTLFDRLRILSFRPFDQSTAEGRGRERHRRVAITAAAAVVAKVFSALTSFISLPLTLHYLGVERFGMWMTISSLVSMLAFADFGIANGVMSAVASAYGRNDRAAIRQVVASGFFILLGVALVIVCAFALVYPFVPWHLLFNVKESLSQAEAGPAVAAFVCCFAAAIPLSIVQRLQMGQQQGFIANLWQCGGSLFGLGAVLVAIHFERSLPWLVLALAGGPQVAALFNSLHCYFLKQPDLRPTWRSVSFDTSRRVAGTGGLFFVLQLSGAIGFTSDSLVVAQLLGASAVSLYAVPDKLFGLIPMVIAMALSPLWPAYAEAFARNDLGWVRRTFKRSVVMAVSFSGAICALFLLAGPELITLWVGHSVTVPVSLWWAFAVWRVLDAFGYALAMFLNGRHVVRLQVICAVPTALSALGLKVWVVPHLGVSGVIWASAGAWVLLTAVPMCIRLPSLLAPRPAGTLATS